MIIRKECIGQVIKKKSPYNSEVFTLTIVNDPEQFRLYQILGLDVFEREVPELAEVKEVKKKKKSKDLDDTSEID